MTSIVLSVDEIQLTHDECVETAFRNTAKAGSIFGTIDRKYYTDTYTADMRIGSNS